VKKSTKMYWYVYNNTVPLLNIAKTRIFIRYTILKIFKFSTISSISLPACLLSDPIALVLWLQIFHPRKVIASILRICYSEEDSSTAPWSFFYPSLLSFLFYSFIKKVRNWRKRCRSTVTASDYVTQKQLLVYVNIIMKHAPLDNRHDVSRVCFFTSSATK